MTATTDQMRKLAASFRAGEVPPAEVLVVHAQVHPLRTVPEMIIVPVGSSVQQIVDACAKHPGASTMATGAVVEINGEPILARNWRLIRPKTGSCVTVKAVAGDFVVTPLIGALASSLSLSPFATSLLTAVIGAGVSFAINALLAPSATETEQAKSLYSISGPRNEVSKWEPVPQVLGEVRMSAKYATSPYTRNIGDDQFAFVMGLWSIGPVDVRDKRLGETPLSKFKGVEDQTCEGYLNSSSYPRVELRGKPDHLNQTLIPREIIQDDLNATLVTDERDTTAGEPDLSKPVTRFTADGCDRFEIDLMAPQGLFRTDNKKGKMQSYTVRTRVAYRKDGTGAWTTLPDIVMEGDNRDPIRRSLLVNPPNSGSYEVRLTGKGKASSGKFSDVVVWSALKSLRGSKPIENVPPMATTALKIQASEQLNGIPDDLNALVCTRGKHWTGSAWDDNSRITNCADLFRHVLQGAANKRPKPDSALDLPTLQRWHDYCDDKDFRFNMVRDFRTSVWDTLRDICAAGRAMPLLRDGKWSVVWEEAGAPVVQHFTPRNSWGFKRTQDHRKYPDALRVKFLNEKKGFSEDEMLVVPLGKSVRSAKRTKLVEFPGVTDPAQILILARYRLAEMKLRPAKMTLMVDFEHLVCTFGDRVACSHDVLMNATLAGARVKAVSGNTVTLDDTFALANGTDYGLRFRRAVAGTSGRSVVRRIQTDNTVGNTLTLSGSGTVPAVGDLCSIGPLGSEAGIYKIKNIRPMDDLTAEILLVDDAPEIQDADTERVPDYDSGIVGPVDLTAFAPFRLRVRETFEVVQGRRVSVTYLSWQVRTVAEIRFFEVTGQPPVGKAKTWRTKDGRTLEMRLENLPKGRWRWRVKSCFRNSRRNRSSAELREAA